MASPSPDAILHLAALHALAQAGFASTSRAASLTLTSAVTKYLRAVAIACNERATLAGRNKVAAIDVVSALEELGVGGVGELHEWTVGLDKEVVLGGGFGGVKEYVKSGVAEVEVLAELKMYHEDEVRPEFEEDKEDFMDIDGQVKEEDEDDGDEDVEPPIRFTSPDLSWLPPLPGTEQALQPPQPTTTISTTSSEPISTPPITNLQSLPLVDRYRRPIPFNQSQLASTSTNIDIPSFPARTLPEPSSSFPSLIKAYEATASEPSLTLRPNAIRLQAVELLRRSIAPVEQFSPSDTLTIPIPPPRISPYVPSYTDNPNPDIPQHTIPLNPNPTGLLSSLVHQINSPNLPPSLRERLTSIRPPNPQLRDGKPIFYGEPVRAPDMALLAKQKGKQPSVEDEVYFRATWDAGPKGMDKWGRAALPKGRKVVQSGEVEDKPRENNPVQPSIGAGSGSGTGTEGVAERSRTLRLRLPSLTEGTISPGGGGVGAGAAGLQGNQNGQSIGPGTMVSSPGLMTPSTPAPGVTGIKLKIGRRESEGPQKVSLGVKPVLDGNRGVGAMHGDENIRGKGNKNGSVSRDIRKPSTPGEGVDAVSEGGETRVKIEQ